MLSKIKNPKVPVPDKDLQGYITEWESDLEFYFKATQILDLDKAKLKATADILMENL